jgi:GT2 family glycosyltransferase
MDLSVIIVNYNVKELLENCINSVLASSKNVSTEIIVVDNNSYDGSLDYIRKKFAGEKRVKLIENRTNLGFSRANNLGARVAKGKYILILNPDTVLQEDTLKRALDFYESKPDSGVVGCKLVLPNGKLDLACRRSFPTPSVAVYRMLGLSKIFPRSKAFGKYNLTYLDENQTNEVDSVCGAFMLIRRDLYEKLGGFDETYFMYGEDLDLCYRIRKLGLKVYYFPGTSAIHFKGSSTRKSSISYVNNFYGAMRIFVQKNLKSRLGLFGLMIKLAITYRAAMSYLARLLSNYYSAFIDLTAILAAMVISIYLRFDFFPIQAYTVVIIVYSIVWMTCLALTGSYRKFRPLFVINPVVGILLGFFINSTLTYYFNEFAFSRAVILRTTGYSLLLMFLWRSVLRMAQYVKHKNIFYNDNFTVIVGKNEESERFVNKLKKRVDSVYNILGYISVDGGQTDGYIGNTNNLRDVIASSKIQNVIFAKSVMTNQQIVDTMWNLRDFNLNFKILSGESEILLGKSALDKIDDIYLIQIEYNINKRFNIFVKRLFDLCFGLLSLILIYPFAFLCRKRGELERFHKKILLIPSVVKGELSFVGRPIADSRTEEAGYLGKNGLTGLVQINYDKKLSDDEIEYYNYYYAKNQTLLLDLEIILKTISLYFFRKRNANL